MPDLAIYSSPVSEYLMRTMTRRQTADNTNGKKYDFNNSTVTTSELDDRDLE